MTGVLIFGGEYRANRVDQFVGEQADCWRSNSKIVGKLEPGDKVWPVTSGKSLGLDSDASASYLVGLWMVADVTNIPGDNPTYASAEFGYRMIADRPNLVLDRFARRIRSIYRTLRVLRSTTEATCTPQLKIKRPRRGWGVF